jgi:hypothetical protein
MSVTVGAKQSTIRRTLNNFLQLFVLPYRKGSSWFSYSKHNNPSSLLRLHAYQGETWWFEREIEQFNFSQQLSGIVLRDIPRDRTRRRRSDWRACQSNLQGKYLLGLFLLRARFYLSISGSIWTCHAQ